MSVSRDNAADRSTGGGASQRCAAMISFVKPRCAVWRIPVRVGRIGISIWHIWITINAICVRRVAVSIAVTVTGISVSVSESVSGRGIAVAWEGIAQAVVPAAVARMDLMTPAKAAAVPVTTAMTTITTPVTPLRSGAIRHPQQRKCGAYSG